MKKIFSGVQPTGNIHLGNYLGAIKGWVQNQNDYHSLFCVVDLHAITAKQSSSLRQDTLSTAALYLACGVKPDVSTVFVQSHVPAHTELAWMLNCVTPMGWLKKMVQFRDKSEEKKENASVGLFAYPLLMAADILLYQTDVVPVGEDQKQHLELCRKIAVSFNSKFGQTFTVPEAMVQTTGGRVMSLTDGTKKMSKSDENDNSRLNLLDSKDVIARKIKSAKMDMTRGVYFDVNRPEVNNMLTVYSLLSGKTSSEAESECKEMGNKDFKDLLTTTAVAYLEPIQRKYNDLINDTFYLERCLKLGAEKANEEAVKTIALVKERMKML